MKPLLVENDIAAGNSVLDEIARVIIRAGTDGAVVDDRRQLRHRAIVIHPRGGA